MNFNSPHSPRIRIAYGLAIEILQGICFFGYLAASYYVFIYGEEFGRDGILSVFGLDKPKLLVWFVISILYLLCFVLLGTLSAIASAEHSLHLLAKKPEVNEDVRSGETFLMSVFYYLNKFHANDGELNFGSEFGAHRRHLTTGLMSIRWTRPEQRTIRNFWGLAGRKDVNFFQFSESACITFIEPTDLSMLHKNIDGTTTQHITLNDNNFAHAILEILVDGRFVRSLKKFFPDNTSEGSDENQFATIHLSGTYRHGWNNFRLNGLNLGDWKRSPKQLAERFDEDRDVPDAMKNRIRDAILGKAA